MSEEAGLRFKLNKKLKLAVGRAKASKDDVKPIDKKKKGSEGYKKVQSSKHKMVDSVPDRELYKRENGGKRNFRSGVKDKQLHMGQEEYAGKVDGKRRFGLENLDRKRNRIYADRDFGEGGIFQNAGVPNRKSLSREGRYSHKDDFNKEKRSMKGKSHDAELSNRKFSCTRGRNSHKDEFIEDRSSKKALRSSRVYNGREDSTLNDKRSSHRAEDRMRSAQISHHKSSTKARTVDRRESFKLDGSEDGSPKKHARSKSDSTKQVDLRQKRRPAESFEKSTKKIFRDKRSRDDDSVVMESQPMKTKRVIRIDPNDISNKRLDDDISTNESTVEKKVDLEKNIEVSKNAQFRAIQPGPSILSFVEDNLLGRRRLIELRRSGYNVNFSAPLDNIPFSTSSERERIEETVFRNKLTFFAAAKISSSFPPADLPEIAFAGRSNVGKSSLLNALTRQWGVVRTSDKPGLTQTINFFNLGSKLCLVDLPGYGFAYAKEEVKEAWEELVKEYVSTRVGLKRVCLLIDTKWGMKPRDHELINLMERSQTKYQIVLTKTDTVFPIDVARRAMQIEESLKANKSVVQPMMMVSSKSGAGIRSLRTILAKITRFAML